MIKIDIACQENRLDVVQFLLENGANTEVLFKSKKKKNKHKQINMNKQTNININITNMNKQTNIN